MMDCANYKELSGLRKDDLSPAEVTELDSHLNQCEMCRREQLADEELFALVDRLPTLESEITASDIRRLDGLQTAEMVAITAGPGGVRRGARWGALLALAAAVTLALLLIPRLGTDPDGLPEGQRIKGAQSDTDTPAVLEIQFSVESRMGDQPILETGKSGGQYGGEQSLVFGVLQSGEGNVTLAETAPDGTVQIVLPGAGVVWQQARDETWTLADESGNSLAYRPDGSSGTYRYEVLLTSSDSRTLGPQDVLSLARGEDLAGVDVLAEDSFDVEWTTGD